MKINFENNVAKFNTQSISNISASESHKNYVPFVDEEIGGVTIYIHTSLAVEFTTYMVWMKPQINPDMDFDSEDWDGWLSRGWDLLQCSNMEENLRTNKAESDANYDITISGAVVAKTTFKAHVAPYTALLNEFFEYHSR
ncbi:hypothetical protein LMH73_009850 [Vibrio splendidus]|nr:hypothetical protein [Vibrio splendidus]MCC4883041.1 hypothetical protein [Vibrio splendidus]